MLEKSKQHIILHLQIFEYYDMVNGSSDLEKSQIVDISQIVQCTGLIYSNLRICSAFTKLSTCCIF